MCDKDHHGGKCPIWTEEYPVASDSERSQSLENLIARADDLERRERDAAVESGKWANLAAMVKKMEQDYAEKQNPRGAVAPETADNRQNFKRTAGEAAGEEAADMKQPDPNVDAARRLFGMRLSWRLIVPGYEKLSNRDSRILRRELNAQAVGEVEMPQDSPLRRKLLSERLPLPTRKTQLPVREK